MTDQSAAARKRAGLRWVMLVTVLALVWRMPMVDPGAQAIDESSAPNPTSSEVAPSTEPTSTPTLEPISAPSLEPTPAPTAVLTDAPAPIVAPAPGVAPTNQYIVTFNAGSSAAVQIAAITAAGATDDSAIAQLRMHAVTASAAGATALAQDPSVVRVELDRSRVAEGGPSDPGYADQWSLTKIGWDQAYGSIDPAGSAIVAVLRYWSRNLNTRSCRQVRHRHLNPRCLRLE